MIQCILTEKEEDDKESRVCTKVNLVSNGLVFLSKITYIFSNERNCICIIELSLFFIIIIMLRWITVSQPLKILWNGLISFNLFMCI